MAKRVSQKQWNERAAAVDVEWIQPVVRSSQKQTARCLKCGHEWKAMPSKIQSGRGCPECAPNSEKSWEQRQVEANAVGAEYLGESRQLPSKQKTLLRCFK